MISRARIAVLPAVFPTGSLPNAQNFSTSETSGEILGMKAENKVGNNAGKTAILALEIISNGWDIVPESKRFIT